MLITIDGSQNSVLAQNITSTLLPSHLPAQDSTSTPTTPAIEPSGSDDESSSSDTTPAIEPSGSDDESSSSDDNENNNSNGDETSSSSGSDDDDIDSQQATSSSDEEDDETEDESDQTNPLLEQIRNNINRALSASGITGP
jgi:hypothetical protein